MAFAPVADDADVHVSRPRLAIDRGRKVRLSRTPLPPNRTGGFPAYGSPVNIYRRPPKRPDLLSLRWDALRMVKGSCHTRALPNRLGRIEFTLHDRLFVHLQLLPTLPHGNAVTLGYRKVTIPLAEPCTQQFNRLHRHTSGTRQEFRFA